MSYFHGLFIISQTIHSFIHPFVLRMTRDIRIYLKTLADNGTEFLHGSNSLGRLSHSQFILPFHSQHRFVPSALALH